MTDDDSVIVQGRIGQQGKCASQGYRAANGRTPTVINGLARGAGAAP